MAKKDRLEEAIKLVEKDHVLEVSVLASRMGISEPQAYKYMRRVKGRGIKWLEDVATMDFYWKIMTMLEGLEQDINDYEELYNQTEEKKIVTKKLIKDSMVMARTKYLDYYGKLPSVHSLRKFVANKQPHATELQEMPIATFETIKQPWELETEEKHDQ